MVLIMNDADQGWCSNYIKHVLCPNFPSKKNVLCPNFLQKKCIMSKFHKNDGRYIKLVLEWAIAWHDIEWTKT